MRFDRDPVGWTVLGNDEDQHLNAERRQLLQLLHEEGPLTPARIAVELGKPRAATRMLLKRMKDDGLIQKQGTGYVARSTPPLTL